MSSHREAPEISKDPVADSTDVYAFVSPDRSDTVTLIANYIPLEEPGGGPNFYEFDDDVLYEIHVDNDGDAEPDISYQFRFTNVVINPDTFLYNVGPITSLTDPNWNRRQLYTVSRVDWSQHRTTVLGRGLASPPCNIGPLSTPDFESLTQLAIHQLPGGQTVYAGQRADGFIVDIGAVFELAVLRPFANLHNPPLPKANGVNSLAGKNVHTIALQIPKWQLTAHHSNPHSASDAGSVIGVWTSASRQKARVRNGDGGGFGSGPFVQVSRLANPLFNEVVVPMGKKDFWNATRPAEDKQFLSYVANPELSKLLPLLYGTAMAPVFPNLAAYSKPRLDLEAILLTGIPSGIVPGFQNFTGATPADLLRLNMAIPPAAKPSNLGVVGGDLAGFPNGRRVFDDVVTIELRAFAGLTIPLVDKDFTPDGAAALISQGLTSSDTDQTGNGTVKYLDNFPYLGTPHAGYSTPAPA